MREFRERGEDVGMVPPDQVLQEEAAQSRTRYHSNGQLPPVSEETGFDHGRTPGTLAFDGDNHARHAEVHAAEKTAELRGTYGTYNAKWQWVTVKGQQALRMEIDLAPDSRRLTRGSKIAFLQVVRRSGDGGDTWAKDAGDKSVGSERATRTDDKTGFRVDRSSTEKKASPFYGIDKNDDGSLASSSNAKIGTVGGDKAWIWDRPRAKQNERMEFISTATEIGSGRQLDAIRWGFGPSFTDMRPEIVTAADDPGLAGRDRAIHKWNDALAEDASNHVDAVPTEYDPTATALTIKDMIADGEGSKKALTEFLKTPMHAREDHRARIRANYKIETGRELSTDLDKALGHDWQKRIGWL